jgi:hypothetical protein
MSSPEQPPVVLPSSATSYGEEEAARCERRRAVLNVCPPPPPPWRQAGRASRRMNMATFFSGSEGHDRDTHSLSLSPPAPAFPCRRMEANNTTAVDRALSERGRRVVGAATSRTPPRFGRPSTARQGAARSSGRRRSSSSTRPCACGVR